MISYRSGFTANDEPYTRMGIACDRCEILSEEGSSNRDDEDIAILEILAAKEGFTVQEKDGVTLHYCTRCTKIVELEETE